MPTGIPTASTTARSPPSTKHHSSRLVPFVILISSKKMFALIISPFAAKPHVRLGTISCTKRPTVTSGSRPTVCKHQEVFLESHDTKRSRTILRQRGMVSQILGVLSQVLTMASPYMVIALVISPQKVRMSNTPGTHSRCQDMRQPANATNRATPIRMTSALIPPRP